ncbi:DUF732 domain-containing protein [Streptomyces sp. HU2014]|uniref:DUF732 domain-containing protein n=1 Tax=Streptomyces sp. HU2014 TaxID=2939414 RepID=UPI00200E646C|nr:DUF732 domain-containing protein [Streptomyces sp. HU2014]UQI46691.1 DUF732 domain-containing protein [Streptomyces sp. HU2014]
MERKTWLGIGVAVVIVAGIGAITGGEDDSSTPEAQPSRITTSTPAEAPKPSSGIPSPDTTQTEQLIRALREIDAGLVAKEDRAVRRARDVCADLKQGKDETTVHSNARNRYQGGTVPSLTDDQAARIVAAVKGSFCH